MKEYIEKDAARDLMERALEDDWEIQYANDRLRDIPAADVVEVRKGRWANGAFGYGHYWCTVCQKEVWSEEEKTNYCPNCGAKMGGGVNDAID